MIFDELILLKKEEGKCSMEIQIYERFQFKKKKNDKDIDTSQKRKTFILRWKEQSDSKKKI